MWGTCNETDRVLQEVMNPEGVLRNVPFDDGDDGDHGEDGFNTR